MSKGGATVAWTFRGSCPGSTHKTFRPGAGPPGGPQNGVGAGPTREKGSGQPVPPRTGGVVSQGPVASRLSAEGARPRRSDTGPSHTWRVPSGECALFLTARSQTLPSAPSTEWKAPEIGASLGARRARPQLRCPARRLPGRSPLPALWEASPGFFQTAP